MRARVAAAWGRWREISNLLVNRNIGLRSRRRVYEACVRSALLYGAETWALMNSLTEVLRSCDRRMLRYMAGVRWQDGRSSSEVAGMCGVEDLSAKLRQRRLRWFGHVERAGEGALNEVRELRVEGWRPLGRPKRRWSGCEGGYEPVGNRGTYGTRLKVVENSHRPSNPTLDGKTRTLNEDDDDVYSDTILEAHAAHQNSFLLHVQLEFRYQGDM